MQRRPSFVSGPTFSRTEVAQTASNFQNFCAQTPRLAGFPAVSSRPSAEHSRQFSPGSPAAAAIVRPSVDQVDIQKARFQALFGRGFWDSLNISTDANVREPISQYNIVSQDATITQPVESDVDGDEDSPSSFITCPACTSNYAVSADQIGDRGRQVRCGKCGHVWIATVEAMKPMEDNMYVRSVKADTDPFKMFVGNIPFTATERDIKNLLKSYGLIRRVKIPTEKDGRYRGYAFVYWDDRVAAEKAVEELDGTNFMGRQLQLSEALKNNQPFRQRAVERTNPWAKK